MNDKETQFYEEFKNATGMDLVFEPCRFCLRGVGYFIPDFLCDETSTYYEVVGSRQRYYQAGPKYTALKNKHPEIKLVIFQMFSEPYGPIEESPSLSKWFLVERPDGARIQADDRIQATKMCRQVRGSHVVRRVRDSEGFTEQRVYPKYGEIIRINE